MDIRAEARQQLSVASLLIGLGLMTAGPAAASQYFADFKTEGTFQTPSWEKNALRVTASDILHFLDLNGIGVVGKDDFTVDPGESVTFTFAAPATQVRLFTGTVGNLAGRVFDAAELEAIGADGVTLGLVSQLDPFPSLDVSAQYSGAAIQSFTIRATADVYIFSGVSYSIAPVPEPSEWMLWMLGLGALVLSGKSLKEKD